MENWEVYININPNIRFGKPCIAGTRITVQDILEWLASGMSFEEIIEDFPELDALKIRAALAFAARREQRLDTIQKAEKQPPAPNNLQALLLTGPVWTEEEYQQVLKTREQLNQVGTNSSH